MAVLTTWSSGSSSQKVTQSEDHSPLVLPHYLQIKIVKEGVKWQECQKTTYFFDLFFFSISHNI